MSSRAFGEQCSLIHGHGFTTGPTLQVRDEPGVQWALFAEDGHGYPHDGHDDHDEHDAHGFTDELSSRAFGGQCSLITRPRLHTGQTLQVRDEPGVQGRCSLKTATAAFTTAATSTT